MRRPAARSDVIAAVEAARAGVRGRVGIACSGGADSIALADAAIRVLGAVNVVIVTIDHGLHGASGAIADEVAAWARGQGAAAITRTVIVQRRASIEAAARDARYAALDAIADEAALATVWTAHTARDQAETVMLRILRGTGPAGLAGIPTVRGRFARPLLGVARAAIDAHVAAHGLPVWADPMNDDLRIARVRVRREILPALRRENPALDAALVRLAASASEWTAVIDALATPFASLPIACAALAAQPAAVRKRALTLALERAGLGYDAVHIDQLDAIVVAPARGERGIDVPGGRVARRYDQLDRVTAEPIPPVLTAPPAGYAVRLVAAGDRMRPQRLRGQSRKLFALFVDARVPRAARVTARVLVRAADGAIVWAEHLGLAFGEPADLAPGPAAPTAPPTPRKGGSF